MQSAWAFDIRPPHLLPYYIYPTYFTDNSIAFKFVGLDVHK
jgi:hypothetical protein